MKAFRHAGIVVSDIERSLRFYKELLGLSVEKRSDEGGAYIDRVCGLRKSRLTTVKLAASDGNLIELLQFHSHPDKGLVRKIYRSGLSHVAFTVDDIDDEYKRLSCKGVEFISPPETSPGGKARIAFCKDPDGVFIELVQVMEGL